MRAFLVAGPDAELLGLINARTAELAEYTEEIGELVTFIVVQAGDAVEQLDAALGFGILSNRFDLTPFGTPGFAPSWDGLVEHAEWFELTYVLSDDSAGTVVYVPKTAAPELLEMCTRYAAGEVRP
ncbi:MAG: hypothetical protein QM788_00510 [Roseateles sp.]|uniref:hypothetical protein n=1 Tax=Roseateles sp. TaxID=1971397 RepID=UPI0039EA4CBF